MTPYFDDGQVTLYQGHVLDCLRELPSDSVQCVITSPPYWALRSYATEPQVWGGTPQAFHHEHEWTVGRSQPQQGGPSDKQKSNHGSWHHGAEIGDCPCGAWRGELGHEPTPQMFVAHLVEVFREVRRVLKSDGCLFVNLGDSYAGSGKGPTGHNGIGDQEQRQGFVSGPGSRLGSKHGDIGHTSGVSPAPGTKAKDLVLIPERFALAMQDDGWFVRSRIAWCKRAPMPESVRDRPTNAWEHIWMFTKSSRYFWDADAVREANSDGSIERFGITENGQTRAWNTTNNKRDDRMDGTKSNQGFRDYVPVGRNMWSYWLLSPDPEPLAHFATFPKEVPRRCIAAATSDRGECPKCGKPWVRVTEGGLPPNKSNEAGIAEMIAKGVTRTTANLYRTKERGGSGKTTGWAPQCACGLPPIPQTVLDPFVGSGTTTMVARSMLRRSIGIDLSEAYLHDIALKKNAQMALMAPDTEAS